MSRASRRLFACWAGVMTITPASFLLPTAAAQEEDGRLEIRVGLLTIPGEQSALGLAALDRLGLAIAAIAPDAEPWRGAAAALGGAGGRDGDGFWRLTSDERSGLALAEEQGEVAIVSPGFVFDMSLDLNTLRARAAQPFSRSVPGRVLDALGVDNARSARLTALPLSPDNPDELALVLFTQSRAQEPGRWNAQPLATVRRPPVRGEPPPEAPLEIDFGEQWGGIVLCAADLSLALNERSTAISTEERLDEWGQVKAGALRGLADAMEGRAWLWGSGESGGWVLALPLQRGASERAAATSLRSVLGQRLAWGRDPEGRATGSLAVKTEDRSPGEGDRSLAVRFITIHDRAVLAIATDAAQLDAAPAVLAKLVH